MDRRTEEATYGFGGNGAIDGTIGSGPAAGGYSAGQLQAGGGPGVGSLALPPPEVGSLGSIEQTTWRNFICKTRHPVAAFFHIGFKGTALILYMFQAWIGLPYVTAFISITLLLAADFWAVKNVTGRLLVGLRWWNRIKEDGSNEWIFESSPTSNAIPTLDRRLFWVTLYGTPILFSIYGVAAFVSLAWDWALVDAVAVGLTGSNLVGYLKCSSDAQKRLQSATSMATGAIGGLSALAAVPGALPALGSSLLGMFGAVTAPTTAAAAGAGTAASVATAGAVAPAIAVTSSPASSFTSPSGASGRQAAVRQQPGSSNSAVNSGVISDFDAVSDPFGTGKRHNDIVSI